jgi:hypothetical protein
MQPGDTTGDTNLSTVSMQPMTADATRVAKDLQPQVGDEITGVTALLYLSGVFGLRRYASEDVDVARSLLRMRASSNQPCTSSSSRFPRSTSCEN